MLRTLDVGRVGADTTVRIFPQLEVSTPGDPAEIEADRAADEVLHMPDPRRRRRTGRPPLSATKSGGPNRPPTPHPTPSPTPPPRAADPAASSTGSTSPVAVACPLAPSERAYFEPRFGADLANVRVHTDPAAGTLAHDLGAAAFARGPDVFFAPGRYAPQSAGGRRLLAHELARDPEEHP
ncbi:DUF4157 domain-containing protein [Actinomycetospora chibensis]|uniref:DUF4157 domain-containing protein n=1 Tax=Actinomycetospora chibensis TaxID=663606 RepID=A0ABV9RP99_9PSEU|nr:DUF4157 domain-containing protein [Actinomycetospora chibensis]MDD7926965.1 DUF4157 domain-containing protein [Actinomycetospora chibensis]